MGAKGILYVNSDGNILASPPKVTVVNTIGAGDSAIAGFIYGIYNKLSVEESLKYAVASGTATILQEGTALAGKREILLLLQQVSIKKIWLKNKRP